MAEGILKEMADLQTDADNFLLESREGRSGCPKGKKQFCSNKDASEVRDYDRITKRDLSDLSDFAVKKPGDPRTDRRTDGQALI